MANIKKKHLKALAFEKLKIENEHVPRWRYEDVEVQLNPNDPTEPVISIVSGSGESTLFPGAYKLKDLQTILYFLYGEDEYSKRFGNAFEARIIKQTPAPERTHNKAEMMDAFDEGFHSADKTSHFYMVPSEDWYFDKYENSK